MPKIVYYVACSLDGFIAGPGDDISAFASTGNGVERYLEDLKQYKTVIMGRRTYEFGYKFGLKPGMPAYPWMMHHIFSETMVIEDLADNVIIESATVSRIKEIRDTSATDVYLCGGGEFAGWMLHQNLIDQLIIKLNPIVLGNGIRLFGENTQMKEWNLIKRESFDKSLEILTYHKMG